MVRVRRGQIVWVSFPEPAGRRPAIVVQGDEFNDSRIATTLVVPLTTNERLAQMPGNIRLTSRQTGLARASVVNVTQLQVIPRASIVELVGQLSRAKMFELWSGINLVLGSPFSLDAL